MMRDGVAFGGRDEFVPAAQKVPQHAVGEPPELAARDLARRRHGLIDRRVRILGPRLEPMECGEQQPAQRSVGRRALHEFRKEEVAAPVAAQRAVGEVHDRRPRGGGKLQFRERRIERAPADHRGDGTRGGEQREGEGVLGKLRHRVSVRRLPRKKTRRLIQRAYFGRRVRADARTIRQSQ